MADALASGASVREGVGVQIPPRALVSEHFTNLRTASWPPGRDAVLRLPPARSFPAYRASQWQRPDPGLFVTSAERVESAAERVEILKSTNISGWQRSVCECRGPRQTRWE
jgi:hypothetical protein